MDASWTKVGGDGETHDIFDGEFPRELNTMANSLVKEMARVDMSLALVLMVMLVVPHTNYLERNIP